MVNEILRGDKSATVERGNSARKRIDKVIQFAVRKRSIDIAVSFSDFGIKVISAQNDFERPPTAD